MRLVLESTSEGLAKVLDIVLDHCAFLVLYVSKGYTSTSTGEAGYWFSVVLEQSGAEKNAYPRASCNMRLHPPSSLYICVVLLVRRNLADS